MIRKIKEFTQRLSPSAYMALFRLKNQTIPQFLFWLARKEKKGTMVYVGMNVGDEFGTLFFKYKRCIGFEANPDNYKKLKSRFSRYEDVEIYNYAASDSDGYVEFNISDNGNNAASGSMGTFNESRNIGISKQIKVESVNLYSFLISKNVTYIDEYISDIEGMDLTALQTLIPFLDTNKIGAITCEVVRDGKENPYTNLESNFASDFNKLLGEKYELVSSGWGYLADGTFDAVPEGYTFMDCKWRSIESEI